MNAEKSTGEAVSITMRQTTNKKRSFGGVKLAEKAQEILRVELFVRRLCPECSETAVAEKIRQLDHVRRVEAHPERHELEIWVGFPARGLMREIVGILNLFCCEMTASHAR
jgi:hypothetical protein